MRKGDGKWEFKLKENGDHTLNWMRLHKTRLDWLHGWVLVGQTEGSLDRTVERSRTTSISYFRAWFDVLELESHSCKLLLQVYRTMLWSGVTVLHTTSITLSHALERSHTRANTDTYNTQGHTSLIATSGLKDISLLLKSKPFWGLPIHVMDFLYPIIRSSKVVNVWIGWTNMAENIRMNLPAALFFFHLFAKPKLGAVLMCWLCHTCHNWARKFLAHPALKREDRLRKPPFAGFGTVMEDIKRSAYTKNQPILLGAFWENSFFVFLHYEIRQKRAKMEPKYPFIWLQRT